MADIGFDSTAIAWAIAHNSEQADSFSNQMKKYRKGVKDGNKGKNSGKLDEEGYEEDINPDEDIVFSIDEDGNTDGEDIPFIGDLTNGITFKCGKNTVNGVTDDYSVTISLDMSQTNGAPGTRHGEGLVKLVLTGSSSGIVAQKHYINNSYWWIIQKESSGYITQRAVKWTIRPSPLYIHAVHEEPYGLNETAYYNMYWTNPITRDGDFGTYDDIKKVLANTTSISYG